MGWSSTAIVGPGLVQTRNLERPMVDNIDIRDTSIDIVKRLRQQAASDKDEHGPAAVIALTLEAAHCIEILRQAAEVAARSYLDAPPPAPASRPLAQVIRDDALALFNTHWPMTKGQLAAAIRARSLTHTWLRVHTIGMVSLELLQAWSKDEGMVCDSRGVIDWSGRLVDEVKVAYVGWLPETQLILHADGSLERPSAPTPAPVVKPPAGIGEALYDAFIRPMRQR